ncbi:MAG: anti-sigma-factor antagonist [Bacillales bacterium]|nr:anti-sigma-factor antagonist [Bacillales bacterium]
MSLSFDYEIKQDILVIRLDGELDHHTADEVRVNITDLIEQHKLNNIVMNLEKLSFMDSSGFGVILGRYKHLKSLNGELIICSVPTSIQRLFDMSGLFKIVRIEATEDDAFSCMEVR